MVIKAAAVADYRVRAPAATKIKGKRDLTLDLVPNPDILKEVAAAADGGLHRGLRRRDARRGGQRRRRSWRARASTSSWSTT